MTIRSYLDVWARVTKQRLPMESRLREWRDRPAIYGGGSEIVCLATVTYSTGDWARVPLTVRSNHGDPVDPVEFAAESHYSEKPDKLAHLPSGKVRQRRAPDPFVKQRPPAARLDHFCVHATVDKAFRELEAPWSVVQAVLRVHPRDKQDPLNEGGDVKDRREVAKWITENATRLCEILEVKR